MQTISYTEARNQLAGLMETASRDREPIIITRKGEGKVMLLAIEEYEAMETTLHLPIGDWYYHDLQYWYVVDSVWCDFVFDDVMDCRNCVITHGTTLK